MRVSKAFTAFAASYFFLVFLKDGTAEKVTGDLATAVRRTLRSGKRLTKIT